MSVTTAPNAPPPKKARARGIPELLASVSASRLAAFHQCRLKFWFRYVLGLAKPKSSALHVGSVVHLVLKHWNKARWKGEQPDLKQLHDVFSASWAAGQAEEPVDWRDESEEEARKCGFRLLETYIREGPIPANEKPEAVEVKVEADLTRHGLPRLVGILDLVRSGGRIVDYKTGGKTPDPEMAAHTNAIQLTCYGVLYRETTGRRERGLELHHLIKTRAPKVAVTPVPPVSDAQQARLFRQIESHVRGLEAGDFVPSPGIQCAGCEFLSECRGWKGGAA
jgi:CRISPR/Cas system-associated exonuclease Cas4 (RecB family)